MTNLRDIRSRFWPALASWKAWGSRSLTVLAVLAGLMFPARQFLAQEAQQTSAIRFNALDIFVDSGPRPLAAYQLTFTATTGDVKIVSIEGGEHPAFKEPPNYDPQAIQQERAILAAFNTASAENLPKGRTRVATVHVRISGATTPVYAVKLEVAADDEGARLTGQTSVQEKVQHE